MLQGKTVVVGVSGGIAAYKAVEVVSRFKKLNADVYVIMTENATKFVAPLTFQSISHNRVIVDMFEEPDYWDIKHISLAQKADLFVVAPATANILGKIANGIADDMLSTTVMATKVPVLFVPAMNTNMYENILVHSNIEKLASLGYVFMEAAEGMLACGTSGRGRMPEPVEIVEKAMQILNIKKDLSGLKILVTAGPTREAIDPVRYISNHSSGKMGYAVAEAAAKRGAAVKLVSGPVNLSCPYGVEVAHITCAVDMYHEVMESYKSHDIIIMAAAVADYRAACISGSKIKKKAEELTIELVKNPDIAKELGRNKAPGKIHIGFCAETNDLLENARKKLAAKNFDMIVANDVTVEGAGFNVDTNIVKLVRKDGSVIDLPMMKKTEVAEKILDEVAILLGRTE